ncbi:MAG: GNAT family N-acetyltransferase [Oscillospiraceae bacterium]
MKEEAPAKNLFMMCGRVQPSAFTELPEGYSFRLCRKGELETWMALQADSPAQMEECRPVLEEYYEKVYAPKGDKFYSKCLFACDGNGTPVGTCFAWNSYDTFTAIHWFKVAKGREGKGIGRAILSRVLEELTEKDYPVFLHTHPTSCRAIKLYSDFGFELLTDPVVGYRNNDLAECLPILEKTMPREAFAKLETASAPDYFLKAAASSIMEEF